MFLKSSPPKTWRKTRTRGLLFSSYLRVNLQTTMTPFLFWTKASRAQRDSCCLETSSRLPWPQGRYWTSPKLFLSALQWQWCSLAGYVLARSWHTAEALDVTSRTSETFFCCLYLLHWKSLSSPLVVVIWNAQISVIALCIPVSFMSLYTASVILPENIFGQIFLLYRDTQSMQDSLKIQTWKR